MYSASDGSGVNLVELSQSFEDDLLGCLLDLTATEELVEDQVDLVEIEDEVQLAHVGEVVVKDFHEEVDGL